MIESCGEPQLPWSDMAYKRRNDTKQQYISYSREETEGVDFYL